MRNVSTRGRDDCFSAATTRLRNVPPMVNKATSLKTGVATVKFIYQQVLLELRLQCAEMEAAVRGHWSILPYLL
jgi:hypothetical protein